MASQAWPDAMEEACAELDTVEVQIGEEAGLQFVTT